MTQSSQSFVQTFMRRRFDPFNPRPEDITLECLAHSLSHVCRFGGHCLRFFSIAGHSLLVAALLPPALRLWGLLHDAAEAIGGDMVRPMKHTPQMAPFRAAEHNNQACFYTKFHLNILNEPYDLIKRADKMAVKLEMHQNLWGGPLPEMAAYVADVPMPDPKFTIVIEDPMRTKARYLNQFRDALADHIFGTLPAVA
jgi:uncharacterized protein